MKTGISIITVMMVLLALGCGTTKSLDGKLTGCVATGKIAQEQLTVHDGKVSFDYTVSFPAGSVGRTSTLKITPVVTYGDKRLLLPASYVQGQGVVNTGFPYVNCHEAFEVVQHYEFPWQEGMENAKISVLTETSACGKLKGRSEQLVYSGGIRLPVPPTVFVQEKVMMTGELCGIVMFPVSGDYVIADLDYMSRLRSELDAVMASPGAMLTSVKVIVSCSPDGTPSFNARLGEERYKVALAYFESGLGLNRYTEKLGREVLSHQVVAQNWKGLYVLLEHSTIAGSKDIIRDLSGADEREKGRLLVKYINRYPVMKNQYLPSLRNAQVVITYEVPRTEVRPAGHSGL